MIRLFQYALIMLWVSQAHGFHERLELKPLYDNSRLNSITLRKPQEKSGAVWVRIINVVQRDAKGVPIEFHESSHLECLKCQKKKSVCSCSVSSLLTPLIESPSSERKSVQNLAIVGNEESPLLPAEAHSSRQAPNRFMQALATVFSFRSCCV